MPPSPQLQQAYCELNRRILEHDKCERRGAGLAELTLQVCFSPLDLGSPLPGPPASQCSGTMKVAPHPLPQKAKWLGWEEGFSIEGISHPLSSPRRGQGAAG